MQKYMLGRAQFAMSFFSTERLQSMGAENMPSPHAGIQKIKCRRGHVFFAFSASNWCNFCATEDEVEMKRARNALAAIEKAALYGLSFQVRQYRGCDGVLAFMCLTQGHLFETTPRRMHRGCPQCFAQDAWNRVVRTANTLSASRRPAAPKAKPRSAFDEMTEF